MLTVNDIFHNRYELLQNIGSGGFTEVWKAMDQMSNMVVAIKIFRKQDEAGIGLCRDEYQKTFGLSHPNIILPFHFDVAGGRPYLVMKYVKGGTLSDRIGQLSVEEINTIISQIGSALGYIHHLSSPMIHGDIKPDNILEDEDGNFYLIDFGISVKLKQKFTETMPVGEDLSSAKGVTPMAYRAPENFRYKNWVATGNSVKSDIWSAGVTLFHCLYNHLPFNGEGGLGQLVMMKSGNYTIEELLDISDFPEYAQINKLIVSCLQLEPEKRTDRLFLRYESPVSQEQVTPVEYRADSVEKDQKATTVNRYLLWMLFLMIVVAAGVGFLLKDRSAQHDYQKFADAGHEQEMIVISDDTLARLGVDRVDASNQNIDDEISLISVPSSSMSERSEITMGAKSFKEVTINDQKPGYPGTDNPVIMNQESHKTEEILQEIKVDAAEKPVTETPPLAASEKKDAKKEIKIRPNIEIPLRLETDAADLFSNAQNNPKISFVVDKDIEAYGEIFLKKGTKVNAELGKVSKNSIEFRIDEIFSSGGSKIVLYKNRFDLKREHGKGTMFVPSTRNYQDILIVK